VRVAIAGGHGKIALRLARLLADRGDEVRSLIRRAEHEEDIRAAGGEPVLCDLEAAGDEEVAEAVDDADVVVFAAGAGPGSGAERKWTMDYGGAVKLMHAAEVRGIDRYLMVSSMGADPDTEGDDTFSVYQRAKGKADADLEASGLAYVIVRPGGLNDDQGTGRVRIGRGLGRGQVPRDDVAAVLAAVVHEPSVWRVTFELLAGDEPVEDAVASLARGD
jgi:nucleoside-diphosphate-sugar epimerase